MKYHNEHVIENIIYYFIQFVFINSITNNWYSVVIIIINKLKLFLLNINHNYFFIMVIDYKNYKIYLTLVYTVVFIQTLNNFYS